MTTCGGANTRREISCPVCGGAFPCDEHSQETPVNEHCGAFEDGCWQFIEGTCRCSCCPQPLPLITFTQEELINLRRVAEIAADYASNKNQTTADEDMKHWSVFVTTFTPKVVVGLLRRMDAFGALTLSKDGVLPESEASRVQDAMKEINTPREVASPQVRSLARELVQVIHPAFAANMSAAELDADPICQWVATHLHKIRTGKR